MGNLFSLAGLSADTFLSISAVRGRGFVLSTDYMGEKILPHIG